MNKLEKEFKITSKMQPMGDQPKAIKNLYRHLKLDKKNQTLLGITGSGKTFTIANVIKNFGKKTLIIAPNKTLAGQLYAEFKALFQENAVHYFVSYYNYYRPESYMPSSNKYIAQQGIINSEIDKMRCEAVRSLVERNDVIVIASVSCIYGLCNPEQYKQSILLVQQGQALDVSNFVDSMLSMGYQGVKNETLEAGKFKVQSETIFFVQRHNPDTVYHIKLLFNTVEAIYSVSDIHREKIENIAIHPNGLFSTPKDRIEQNVHHIRSELRERVQFFEQNNMPECAQRIRERTEYDIEMLLNTGYCKGIENYCRYLEGRQAGDTPETLMSFFAQDALVVVDESHITLPQLHGMQLADSARKNSLIEYGFRLPSCKDNRPLRFDEWDKIRPNTIFVSATPGEYEHQCGNIVHQIHRPTGLLDPICTVLPNEEPVKNAIQLAKSEIEQGGRVIMITFTKKTAEYLSEDLNARNIKTKYIHSDIKTLQRLKIIQDLKNGEIDIVIGINLLREGIDIPQVSLVIIFDADKEGYLRSTTSLIQIIGRAARNVKGKVIMFANNTTKSMQEAIKQTHDRRKKQEAFNIENNITPKTAEVSSITKQNDKNMQIEDIQLAMIQAANNQDFETAIELRNKLKEMEKSLHASQR